MNFTPSDRPSVDHPPEQVAPGATPRSTRRRSTARGVVRVIVFFALVIAAAYALDAAITAGLRRIKTSKFGSLNQVFSGRVNADIVINGSSRALVHYDPRIIEKATGLRAYNLGMNAIQIDVQLAVLRSYLAHNTKPKIVIQNLESFSFEPTKAGEIYDPAAYVPYLGTEELYRPLLHIDRNVWKWKHIPLYGYAVEDMAFTWVWGLLGLAGYSGGENYFQGFNPRYLEWTEDFSRFKAGVASGVTYRIEPEGVAALREIMKLCRENGITLILVFSPEYYEMQAMERNRAEIFAKFSALSGEFGAPFWDYSDSYLCRDHRNFYNSQHLNASGAEMFSTDVARRLKAVSGTSAARDKQADEAARERP